MALKAIGSEPATSPNPPTLIRGAASAAKNKTFKVDGSPDEIFTLPLFLLQDAYFLPMRAIST